MPIARLSDLSDASVCPVLVLKVGSSLLVGTDGQPRPEWLASLATEIAAARTHGQKVIVVSSGAIALGASRLKMAKGGRGSLADAQAAAAVGQIALAGLWSEALQAVGMEAAQLLVTLDDLEDRRRYLNAAATLDRLLAAGAVPVVNENDSVATEEIRFGDNDRLAARVAQAGNASAVLLLSDVDGLFDRDPATPDAKLVRTVAKVSPELRTAAADTSNSGIGTGGMASKLEAADIAQRAGIALAIVNGTHNGPIGRALGNDIGSMFTPLRKEAAKRSWLGGRMQLTGTITVDEGCLAALRGGASLLASGIVAVKGSFQRGDVVAVSDSAANIAKGLTEYSSDECKRIMGRKTGEQADLLGYAPRAAVIHRDHLVLL
ncbi:Glutamate 5-kinase [Alteripontixanthobacter maritimus]|uniref:Glutamate 5-kinase n=1 Tax=Alteripontixanthobacter maritimus TaxID=2161824 RepID=A0A369Q4D9_9SPHN|nr:glutamate 5-kinase [Alteripontixanthobacter maritimus]RDC59362.1 Glutamate 5-kinase [Alteripontixanthobacter maritimus]